MNRLDQVQPISIELAASDKDLRQNRKLVRDAQQEIKIPIVGFRSIQIREYERIVGDHPDVTNGGPPLSIGWNFQQREEVNLEEYEKQKEASLATTEGKPWLQGLRRLSSGRRRDLLRMEFEVSLKEIERAEAKVELVKKQREQTNKQKKIFARTEEIMQAASRKMKRSFSRDILDYQSFPKRRELPVPATVPSSGSMDSTTTPKNIPRTLPPKPLRMREISV